MTRPSQTSHGLDLLTAKQRECLELFANGYPGSKLIARKMNISPKMVDKHFGEAIRRFRSHGFELDDRNDLLVIWNEHRREARGAFPPVGASPLPNLALIAPSPSSSTGRSSTGADLDAEAGVGMGSEAECRVASNAPVNLGPVGASSAEVDPQGRRQEIAGGHGEAITLAAFQDHPTLDPGCGDQSRRRVFLSTRFARWADGHELNVWQRLALICAYAAATSLLFLTALGAVHLMIAYF